MTEQHDRKHNNIVLIGMPGAGKSTLGVLIAKMLCMHFVDVDLVIQKAYGTSLQNLIDEHGPEGFIQLENEALCHMDAHDSVISTGGSAVYSHQGMQHLSQEGTVVYLRISLEELERRLADFSERGVVMRGACCCLRDLYEERLPLYERYADITVDVEGASLAEEAAKVVTEFRTAQ